MKDQLYIVNSYANEESGIYRSNIIVTSSLAHAL
jgi:hypothetical protein